MKDLWKLWSFQRPFFARATSPLTAGCTMVGMSSPGMEAGSMGEDDGEVIASNEGSAEVSLD